MREGIELGRIVSALEGRKLVTGKQRWAMES